MMKRRSLLKAATLSASALLPITSPVIYAASTRAPVLLVLGDSLSAEYGLPRDTGWVKLLEERLAQSGAQFSVVNASISGETTSGGLTRLPDLLKTHQPRIVVIELGANDGLRGLSVVALRSNLRALVKACRSAGARVLLVGIRVPPNYGPHYGEDFFSSFEKISREEKISYLPFLLEGFAENADMFQSDRLHPTEAAQSLILNNVWPKLQPLLR